jgi:hypothetical protein
MEGAKHRLVRSEGMKDPSEEREEMMPMEGAKHRLVRSEGMKDPSGEDEPFEGGSATRRKSTRN